MLIACCADVHIGNHRVMGGPLERRMNVRCRQVLRTLRDAVKTARYRGADVFVVCGDIFDTCDPCPQMLDATYAALREHQTDAMKIYLLAGNHDQWTGAHGDNALGPLARLPTSQKGMIEVVDQARMVDNLIFAPFVPHQPAEETIANWLEKCNGGGGGALLFAHAGVKDASTPPWLASSIGSVDSQWLLAQMKKHDLRAAFFGDWHDARQWGDSPTFFLATQCGALCPTGFDNPSPHDPSRDTYGRVWFYNTAHGALAGATHTAVPGPRFLSFDYRSDPWLTVAQAYTAAGHQPFVRLHAEPNMVATAAQQLQEAKHNDDLWDGEVLPISNELRASQTIAHMTHRQGRPIEESVAKFCDDYDVGENDRGRIRGRVLDYVKAVQTRG